MFEDDADEEDGGAKPTFCSETAALGAVVSVEQAAIPATEAAQRAVSVRFIFVSSGILRLTESVDGTGITEVKLSRVCAIIAPFKQTIRSAAPLSSEVFFWCPLH